ncbi:GLPGLI family protein [Albibacterium bauzanense]|uniref:GLPGLI family protein n=1 Tax=Albibacterium bauzanense TaxID=653929 RepID=A0A4V2PY60_9SPHI|nr:GLPGLI family protein [Albibacterium bauzanense]TCK84771.1 GLPGLI family protein [Albibacterium bauzanense]
MKTILMFGLLSGFLFNIAAFAQEQQSFNFDKQAIYKMTYQPDSTDKGSIKEEYMELLFNDSISLFESVNKRIIDSLELQETLNENSDIMSNPYTIFHYQILKQNSVVTTFDVLENGFKGPNHFYYIEDKTAFQWEIKEDTVTINKLLCQKAELNFANRKWVAWFTTDIPISDGPYKFSGLPGLIIKINDSNNFWNFELTRLEIISKSITINFKKDKQPVLTTKKEFLANKKYFTENSLQIREMYGLRIMAGRAEMQRNSNEYFRKHSNWIELPF